MTWYRDIPLHGIPRISLIWSVSMEMYFTCIRYSEMFLSILVQLLGRHGCLLAVVAIQTKIIYISMSSLLENNVYETCYYFNIERRHDKEY